MSEFVCLFTNLFLAMPGACGSSRDGDQTWVAAVARPDLNPPHPRQTPCVFIFNANNLEHMQAKENNSYFPKESAWYSKFLPVHSFLAHLSISFPTAPLHIRQVGRPKELLFPEMLHAYLCCGLHVGQPHTPSKHTSSMKAFLVPTQQMWLLLSWATLSMLVLFKGLILFFYYNYFWTWFSTAKLSRA